MHKWSTITSHRFAISNDTFDRGLAFSHFAAACWDNKIHNARLGNEVFSILSLNIEITHLIIYLCMDFSDSLFGWVLSSEWMREFSFTNHLLRFESGIVWTLNQILISSIGNFEWNVFSIHIYDGNRRVSETRTRFIHHFSGSCAVNLQVNVSKTFAKLMHSSQFESQAILSQIIELPHDFYDHSSKYKCFWTRFDIWHRYRFIYRLQLSNFGPRI